MCVCSNISDKMLFVILALFVFFDSTFSLQNGLSRTPPMGWNSWDGFYCQTDCTGHPNSCISENLYMGQADRLVSDGYLAVGYNSIHIDDCWLESQRSSDGKLVANRTRFPSGMDGLAKYMHDRNLTLGIYEDVGYKTCAGFPGSWGNEDIDAQTFADWGIDFVKYDGCNLNYTLFSVGFPKMRDAIAKTSRPMVYSIEWDVMYMPKDDWTSVNYTQIAETCNLNRVYNDNGRVWAYTIQIIDYVVSVQDVLIAAQGPGYWNDPDLVLAGNPELTVDDSKVQMTVWSIWSAPLILSNDLRNMLPGTKEVVQNKYVIAVNQDPLGIMGRMVNRTGDLMTFVKPMTPVLNNNSTYSYALAFWNRGNSPYPVSFVLSSLGLTNPSGYNVMDLWAGKLVGTYKPTDTYTVTVNMTSVHFIKATALQ